MVFRDRASVDAWRRSTVSHGAWKDWLGHLKAARRPDETVAKRLAWLQQRSERGGSELQRVSIDGLRVELVYDVNEDAFTDGAGDVAALIRSAGEHGAKGTFYFLGTTGAERTFCWEITLAKGTTTRAKLTKDRMEAVYRSKGYKAFRASVEAHMLASTPGFAAFEEARRAGVAAGAAGADLHARVVATFSRASDAEIAAAASAYPIRVPDGHDRVVAKKVFGDAASARSRLSAAATEEHRAAALWTAARIDPERGLALALEATAEGTRRSAPVRAAALFALARGTPDWERATSAASRAFLDATSTEELDGARAVFEATRWSGAPGATREVLRTMSQSQKASIWGGTSRAIPLLQVIEKRGWKQLAKDVAAFATSKADAFGRHHASQLVLAWGEKASLSKLSGKKARPIDDTNSAAAWLALDPESARERVRELASRNDLSIEEQRLLHFVVEAVRIASFPPKQATSLLWTDPAWVEIGFLLIQRTDRYAQDGSSLLACSRPTKETIAALEARLTEGTRRPYDVFWALGELGVKKTHLRALVAARAKVATDVEELQQLARCK